MTAPDGDDYTWSGSPLERAVLNTVAAARSLNTVSPAPMRDLRTPDQVARDDIAALRDELRRLGEFVRLKTGPVDVALEVDAQGAQLGDFGRRLDVLEMTVAKLVTLLEVRF